MQSAEKYTSLFHWLTQCVSSRLPQHGRRSTKALASSAWCRWWRRVPRSGLGSRDSNANRRQEWLEMFIFPKGIRWHEPHAGKQLCIGPYPMYPSAFNRYLFYIIQPCSKRPLSLSCSGGAAPCSRENPADRHLQKDVSRHEA